MSVEQEMKPNRIGIVVIAVIIFPGAILTGCASVKMVGKNRYEIACSGDINEACQEKAWEKCNGPFKTLKDDQTGYETYGGGGMGVTGGTTNQYKLIFMCEE